VSLDLDWLADELETFATDREWHRFHNPKNLAMALAVEAGELLEEFQWLTFDQAQEHASSDEVANKVADVLIYLVRLASVAQLDLEGAVRRKLTMNRAKHPAP